MSNSRAINLRADAYFRGKKRSRADANGSYHDRVVDTNDFEVVHSRELRLNPRGRYVETPRSPQKGRTSWTVGSTWAPVDDTQLGLDPSGDWCDEEYEKEVTEEPRPTTAKKPKKQKSRVSVCFPSFSMSVARSQTRALSDAPTLSGRRNTGRHTSTK